MDNVWLASALWIGLALLASIISIRIAMSVALVEIIVGAVAGNAIGLDITPWVNFLAGFGAIMLTFLAGTEIDSDIIRRKLGPSFGIGVVSFTTLTSAAGLILVFLALKMITKFAGILPLTRFYEFDGREGMFTTLLMSTGLTFGTISALFGLTKRIIDLQQYAILVAAVIGSAVVPTLIAQRWFMPVFKPLQRDAASPKEASNV